MFIHEITKSRSLARRKVHGVISRFRRGGNEIYALLGSYAAYGITNLRCVRSQKSADLKVKFYSCLAEHHLIKPYGTMEVQICVFTSARINTS